MSADDTEICGFLDVKSGKRYTAQRLKKRALVSSRVWKRLWCSIKRLGPGLGMQVQFGSKFGCGSMKQCESDNSIIIPSNAVVYRIRSTTKQFAFGITSTKEKLLLSLSANSETETQRWMANIRHLLKPRRYCSLGKFYVSIVDNAHSKAAGLTGLHGDLTACKKGIFIKNIYTGETLQSFEWKEFSHFHLTTAGRPEDVKRICVLHTTGEFHCGIGELHIFCLDANSLLRDLVTQGRGPRSKQKALDLDSDSLETSTQYNEIIDPRPQLQRNAKTSLGIVNVNSNCLRASVCTKTIRNVYQSEPSVMYGVNEDSSGHAVFNTSTSSGIYEEIVENICPSQSRSIAANVYQNVCKTLSTDSQMEPPPLPPRRREKSEKIEEIRITRKLRSSSKISNVRERLEGAETYVQEAAMDSFNYVPMSPQMRNANLSESNVAENSKDESYVIMR